MPPDLPPSGGVYQPGEQQRAHPRRHAHSPGRLPSFGLLRERRLEALDDELHGQGRQQYPEHAQEHNAATTGSLRHISAISWNVLR